MIKNKVQVVLFFCDANKQNQFLLLQTNERRGAFWQNITGGVDPGEETQKAALREAIEETNLEDNNIKSLLPTDLKFEFHDRWGNDVMEQVFLLECEDFFEVKIDPEEHQDYRWVPENELNPEVVKYQSNWQALKLAIQDKANEK